LRSRKFSALHIERCNNLVVARMRPILAPHHTAAIALLNSRALIFSRFSL